MPICPILASLGLSSEGSATLTGEAILGTPTYMSPEQIMARRTSMGTDIYALGF